MNFSALALVGVGGYLLYAYYKSGGNGGGTVAPGAGSGGSGTSGGSAGTSPTGGTGAGAGAGGGATGGSPDADMRPLAAAGDPAWVALADQSGLRYTYDQWSWYRNQVLPAFTGAQMDAVIAGNDRNTLLLASEWRAAVDAAMATTHQESAWAT